MSNEISTKVKSVQAWIDNLKGRTILTDDDYRAATEYTKIIKSLIKELDNDPKKAELYLPYKAKLDEIAAAKKPLEEGERIVKQKLSAYSVLLEARARQEALKQEQEFKAQAKEMGIDPDEVEAPVFTPEPVKVAGLSFRDVTEIDIEHSDPRQIPDQFWVVDWAAVKAAINSGIAVPGVATKVNRISVVRTA